MRPDDPDGVDSKVKASLRKRLETLLEHEEDVIDHLVKREGLVLDDGLEQFRVLEPPQKVGPGGNGPGGNSWLQYVIVVLLLAILGTNVFFIRQTGQQFEQLNRSIELLQE